MGWQHVNPAGGRKSFASLSPPSYEDGQLPTAVRPLVGIQTKADGGLASVDPTIAATAAADYQAADSADRCCPGQEWPRDELPISGGRPLNACRS